MKLIAAQTLSLSNPVSTSKNHNFSALINALGQPQHRTENHALWEDVQLSRAQLQPLANDCQADFSLVPQERRLSDFKFAAFDMDSTLINIECIDEIADYVGKKAQVAAITEAAMRGEISDYSESLRQRVALLKGLPESALDTVYRERLQLNPGVENLIEGLHKASIKTLVVSGGFTFFTERLKHRLGLDFAHSNQLEIINGVLTGQLVGRIVDAQVKQNTVSEYCQQIGCSAAQTIAVGDGANDLKMMAICGVSVAYRAKPVVQAQASCAINYTGLDTVLSWLSGELIR